MGVRKHHMDPNENIIHSKEHVMDPKKSVVSNVLSLFVLIELTKGWCELTEDWLNHAKNRGY